MLTLARLIEQLLKQGKSGDETQNCFASLLDVSIRLKEARDGKDEHGSDDAEDDSDNDEDEDEDDDTDNDDYDEVGWCLECFHTRKCLQHITYVFYHNLTI